jgi:hypothetical protein
VAITAQGSFGSVTEKTSDTSVLFTATEDVPAGNVAFLFAATDNIGTTEAELNEAASEHAVADESGNTWTYVGGYRMSAGAGADGVTISLWKSIITTQIDSGDDVTLTLDSARTSKCFGGFHVSITASDVEVVGTKQFDGGTTDALPDQTISGLSSAETLFLVLIGVEAENSVIGGTEDPDYTTIHNISTTGGGVATRTNLFSGFRILTGTGDTTDYTLDTSRDYAQMFVALREVAGGTSETPTPGGATASGTAPSASVTAAVFGATAGGNAPSPRAVVAAGGATGSGFQASATAAAVPTPGGSVAGGQGPGAGVPPDPGGGSGSGTGPGASVGVSAFGATVSGNSPTATASATPAPGGASTGGSAPTASVGVGTATVTVSGLGPGAVVSLSPGGAVVGGNAPGEGGGGISESPTPGGAVVGGAGPAASVIASQGGSPASGFAPTVSVSVGTGGVTGSGTSAGAIVSLMIQGAIVGGRAPIEAFPGSAVFYLPFNRPTPEVDGRPTAAAATFSPPDPQADDRPTVGAAAFDTPNPSV